MTIEDFSKLLNKDKLEISYQDAMDTDPEWLIRFKTAMQTDSHVGIIFSDRLLEIYFRLKAVESGECKHCN